MNQFHYIINSLLYIVDRPCPVQKVLPIKDFNIALRQLWPSYASLHQHLSICHSEVERLLSAEQKATDYKSPDDGIVPDHRPTNTCIRVVSYLSRVLEASFTALEEFYHPGKEYNVRVASRCFAIFAIVGYVLGTDELNTYLQRYHLEQDPHLVALVGRYSRKPWTSLVVLEAVAILDKLLRYDHQEGPLLKKQW
ncbi:casein kinase II subunit alpha-like protein [Tanacetum coccineum]